MKKILDQKCQNIFYQNIVKFAECSTIVGVFFTSVCDSSFTTNSNNFLQKKRWKCKKINFKSTDLLVENIC